MEPTDEQLLEQFAAGDVAAFEQLYGRYEAPLFTFLASLGGTLEQAEDVFQMTWLAAMEKGSSYRGQGAFRSWLFRIGHRRWLDSVRRGWEARRVVLPEGSDWDSLPIDERFNPPPQTADPRLAAVEAEESAALRRALEQLPDQMRQAVLLRIDGDLTYQQIADAMGSPLGTALWRVREGEKRITAVLSEPKEAHA